MLIQFIQRCRKNQVGSVDDYLLPACIILGFDIAEGSDIIAMKTGKENLSRDKRQDLIRAAALFVKLISLEETLPDCF